MKKFVCIFILTVFAFITVMQPAAVFAEDTAQEAEASSEAQEESQEYEQQADSWRFQNGYIVDGLNKYGASKARAAFTPWSKSGGNYISSDGSVIQGALKKGIDVSAWQDKINWEKVKASGDIDFVIIRCGYGSNYKSQDDKYWEYNVSECERLGIPYGVYLYSYANSTAKAKSEAQHVLRLLKGHNPTYPVYYDLEDSVVSVAGKTNIVKFADTFCSTMEANGYTAGIYASLSWWNDELNSSTLDKYEKWVAQWYSKCEYEGSYGIWQCTSEGTVSGINGNVDIDFTFVDYEGSWITDENGQEVFRKTDGTIAKSQWIVYRGSKYYVGSKGTKLTGLQTISGARYYFNSGGVMQKSKWITVSGKKYYFLSTGKAATGYRKIGNYYYGFNSGGVMLTGTAKIGSKQYKFDSKGRSYLYTAKIKTALNYRTGPSTGYAVKGTLKKNKVVAIIRESSGWGQMTNGYWVKLSYTSKVTKYPKTVSTAGTSSYKVKTTTALNYRTGPGTGYKAKGTYKKGTTVTIKSSKNGWGQMTNGYWIKLSYTKKV